MALPFEHAGAAHSGVARIGMARSAAAANSGAWVSDGRGAAAKSGDNGAGADGATDIDVDDIDETGVDDGDDGGGGSNIYTVSGPHQIGASASLLASSSWTTQRGELRYPNGDVYRGPLLHGVPSCDGTERGAAAGTMLYGDGAHYTGGFVGGFFGGVGVFSSPNYAYSGEFAMGMPNGRGTALTQRFVLLDASERGTTGEFGAFFDTPRLVCVTELTHGMFVNGTATGVGGRFTVVSAMFGVVGATAAVPIFAASTTPPAAASPQTAPVPAPSSQPDSSSSSSSLYNAIKHALAKLQEHVNTAAPPLAPLAGTRVDAAASLRRGLAAHAPGIDALARALCHAGMRDVMHATELGTFCAVARQGSAPAVSAVLGTDLAQLDGDACTRHVTVWPLDAGGRREQYVFTRAFTGVCARGRYHGAGTLVSIARASSASPSASSGSSSEGPLLVNDVYEGEFRDGMLCGEGTLRTHDGKHYDGAFADGVRHGVGTSVRRDGTRVSGTRVRGVKEGRFEAVMANGDVVEHVYVAGRRQLVFSARATNAVPALVYALPAWLRNVVAPLVARRAAIEEGTVQAQPAPAAPHAGFAARLGRLGRYARAGASSGLDGAAAAARSLADGARTAAGAATACVPRGRGDGSSGAQDGIATLPVARADPIEMH